MANNNAFDALPVELIADILSELDLSSLIIVSSLSSRLRAVSSEPSLNPWRRPILRTLRGDGDYDPGLKNLAVRSTAPRQNFIEVLSIARARYLLFEASLPNLKESEWQECFRRRFLPGWAKAKKDGTWKEAFLKVLYRVWHRSTTSCMTEEIWTKYIVLNRNGTANELEGNSRGGFNPMTYFEQLREQNDLLHLQPSIRVLVELADVRILAIGVLSRRKTAYGVNLNARTLLHPPGIETGEPVTSNPTLVAATNLHSETAEEVALGDFNNRARNNETYQRLTHPLPALSHDNYPLWTPGEGDRRWIGTAEHEENGMQWVGSMMLTAQLIGPHTKEPFVGLPMQDRDLVEGPHRGQYASLTFEDLSAVAPWLEGMKLIIGPGLGHDD